MIVYHIEVIKMENKKEKNKRDVVLELAKLLEFVDSNPSVINLQRIKDLQTVYNIMNEMALNLADAKLAYRVNTPFKNCGDVSVETNEINLVNTRPILDAALIADNMDIYPLADGRVKICFGFNTLTVPIV